MPSGSNPKSAAVDGVIGWVLFLRAFWRMAGGPWRSRQRWSAIVLASGLVLLTAMQVGVAIALNIWNLRFFDAVEQKALDRFFTLIGVFALIILANVAITISHLQVKRRIQVNWRRWLTRRLMRNWMTGGRHYTLGFAPGRHDNPDGRIAEDIRIATEYAIDIGHSGLYSTMLLITFVNILWSLSGTLDIAVFDTRVVIPGYLVLVALVYTAAGAWIALLLGRPMTQAATRRQASEADFRFGLARARTHSLGIALMRGEPDERRRFLRLFHRAYRAWDVQTSALRRFFYYMATWPLLNQIFPILVAAPRFITGSITLGVMMQTAQAFGQVVAALSWPIDNLAKASEWRASAERVMQMQDALAGLHRDGESAGHIGISTGTVKKLEFRGLVLTDADSKPLTAPIDLTILPGERVMIDGDPALTGHLFHAAAGLWPWGYGRITRPVGAAVHFMPERPYIPVGSLHDALCYPAAKNTYGILGIVGALTRAGLASQADHLEDSAIWDQTLSLADQQRLGFARLLLVKPEWVVLHDATTALAAETELDMMNLIREACPEAAIVIIGTRPALNAGCDRVISLKGA
ncbi:SbmA/BacA-like family transporter [Emcibacter sp. SYSU 3D8]|uniref:ABC transporter ATP-binding protein/permease n=1 Tax=Emcibacter sp. SYSU 3D8 TaxID=3133969 RepID=UPI0031FE8055